MVNTMLEISELVSLELGKQYEKFGDQSFKTILQWNAIIIEEFLEIEKAINEYDLENLKTEIIQTIACLSQLYVKL